jgi:hypothetical protein
MTIGTSFGFALAAEAALEDDAAAMLDAAATRTAATAAARREMVIRALMSGSFFWRWAPRGLRALDFICAERRPNGRNGAITGPSQVRYSLVRGRSGNRGYWGGVASM